MGLLTPKGKKGDKKAAAKTATQSKFMLNKNTKAQGNFGKKGMTGGSQRGS